MITENFFFYRLRKVFTNVYRGCLHSYTSPGKAALAFNGLVAADLLLVPASAERMSVDGISDLVNHVQEIFWHKFRDALKDQEIRILFTMYKANTCRLNRIALHLGEPECADRS